MKFLLAIAVALGISAAAYGAAATLIVNGGTIQYGEDQTLTCDDEIEISYASDGAIPPRVDTININGISSACDGHAMRVQLTNNGAVIYDANPVAIPGGVNHSIPAGSRPLVTDVTDVHVTIY